MSKPWTKRNRVASALRNEHVRIETRPGVGRALIAAKPFAPGECVTAYQGRVISRMALVALRETDRPRFEQINEYAISTRDGGHLFAENMDAPGAHIINHSCGPNATWAEWDHEALLVRAVRPIAEGDEITVFYGWLGLKSAMEKTWHKCMCTAPFCAKTVELRIEWLEDETDNTGGPLLPEQEVVRRFLADIVNGIDDHEALLLRYGSGSTEMMPMATVLAGLDPEAFLGKLRACAEVAVRAALCLPDAKLSKRRLYQIADSYGVNLGAPR